MAYRTSNQKWFPLKLVYKNRGVDHGTNIGGFGPKWECNWIGILQTSASSTATNFMSGGGVRPYTSGAPAYSDGRTMVNAGALTLSSPRGGQNTYSYPAAAQAGLTNNFLDRRIDRYGRVVRYN